MAKKLSERDSPLSEEVEEVSFLELIVEALVEMGIDLSAIDQSVISSVLQDSSVAAGKVLLRQLRTSSKTMVAEREKFRQKFERRLHRKWATSLGKLEMLIVCAYEAGAACNERGRPDAVRSNDLVFDVLTRVFTHARAKSLKKYSACCAVDLLQGPMRGGVHCTNSLW